MIAGGATVRGTARFAERFPEAARAGHFRAFGGQSRARAGSEGLLLSSIGLGTYLGPADDSTDDGYEAAILAGLERGVNMFDTASNYRRGRSETVVGRALERAFESGSATRDEVFVSTKVGFHDSGHSLEPEFLEAQIEQSLRRLGLGRIDLLYLHNPETQLPELPDREFEGRLGEAFRLLERKAREGVIGSFGVATWTGLRVGAREREHLSLERLVDLAIDVAGDGRPHFRAVQLPLNLAMPEALAAPTQTVGEVTVPLLTAARRLNVAVVSSASLLQGRLANRLPEEIAAAFPECATHAERALQFARSAPGLTTALVGMSRVEHVIENLRLAVGPVAAPESYRRLF